MKSYEIRTPHRGLALVVSLLFLLIVTVISLIAASNSSMGLKMSNNMSDASSSFQSAEAGVLAVLALAKDAANDSPPDPTKDPLDEVHFDLLKKVNRVPFAAVSLATDHPLRNINDGTTSVEVNVFSVNPEREPIDCAPSAIPFSSKQFGCGYYRVESEHEILKKARTKVNLGVEKIVPRG